MKLLIWLFLRILTCSATVESEGFWLLQAHTTFQEANCMAHFGCLYSDSNCDLRFLFQHLHIARVDTSEKRRELKWLIFLPNKNNNKMSLWEKFRSWVVHKYTVRLCETIQFLFRRVCQHQTLYNRQTQTY